MSRLRAIAVALAPEGKGILAADESEATIGRRFGDAGIESTPQACRAYREMPFTTPGVEEFIGVLEVLP